MLCYTIFLSKTYKWVLERLAEVVVKCCDEVVWKDKNRVWIRRK